MKTKEHFVAAAMQVNMTFVGASWMHKPKPRAEAVIEPAWQEIQRLYKVLETIRDTSVVPAAVRKLAAAALDAP